MYNTLTRVLSSHQREEFMDQLEDAGLTPDIACSIVKDKAFAEKFVAWLRDNFNVYLVDVNYTAGISELLEQGKYDRVSDGLTDKNFPVEEICPACGNKAHNGTERLALHVMNLNLEKDVSTEQAEAELHKQGLRACCARELLAFGIQYPDIQKHFPILALRSSLNCNGQLFAPYLLGDAESNRRDVGLGLDECGWSPSFRFLARSIV